MDEHSDLIRSPVKWLGQKLSDQLPSAIASNTNEVVIIASRKTKSDMLCLKVTEEWIGARIWCGVEYKEPLNLTEPLDSVTRWSSSYRLNGMRNQ